MTPDNLVIAAVLLQGLLALIVLVVLGFRRVPKVMSGQIKIRDIALDASNWPEGEQQAANAFNNQFQLPVLFYVAAGLTIYFGSTWLDAALALLFVASRYVHAQIHVTSNYVPNRFTAYVVGFLLLALWWLVIAVRLIATMIGA